MLVVWILVVLLLRVVFVWGDLFMLWCCKKQYWGSKSSAKAEYRVMSDVSSELVWLRRLHGDLGVDCDLPFQLYVDITSEIQIATNPVLHDSQNTSRVIFNTYETRFGMVFSSYSVILLHL
ncbi:unnamed protein product [Linum trigynum]|uniref:Uncharacterized protein n=1 Tax=Linum trigynum TaxID=586398 RepID=A0AAV2FQ23_9ROSI